MKIITILISLSCLINNNTHAAPIPKNLKKIPPNIKHTNNTTLQNIASDQNQWNNTIQKLIEEGKIQTTTDYQNFNEQERYNQLKYIRQLLGGKSYQND
jgi:hypothetical protein